MSLSLDNYLQIAFSDPSIYEFLLNVPCFGRLFLTPEAKEIMKLMTVKHHFNKGEETYFVDDRCNYGEYRRLIGKIVPRPFYHPVYTYTDVTYCYTFNNILHREDGPAIEYYSGSKEWWYHGKRHRVDDPAIEKDDGLVSRKEWYIHGNLHREDGPAIEWHDGTKYWYINGKRIK